MKTRIAYSYNGYLCSSIAAIGDEEISKLDLTEQTEHYHSMGWDEPIYSTGLANRYTVEEIDIPEWLIEGYAIEHDGLGGPVRVVVGRTNNDIESALRDLLFAHGKFAESLREFYRTRGFLSPRQRNALATPAWKKFRR